MMEIYPYGGFWAYLKYHYIDGVHLQSLLLIDKTRYNYKDDKKVKRSGRIKNNEEIADMLSNFRDATIDNVRQDINE